MGKKRAVWLKIGIVLLLAAIAAAAGYFAIFHNADVLKIENGKIAGAKSTWLVGKFSENGGEERYYKLGDVGAPRNYTAVKDAPDTDGDPLTTFFCFAGKDAEKNPGTLVVRPVYWRLADGVLLHIDEPGCVCGWGAVGGKEGYLAYWEGEAGRTLSFLTASPYEDACVEILVTLPAGASDEDLLALCQAMADKVTLGKQLSPIAAEFKLNFLDDNRWEYLLKGLGVTLQITLFAVLMGIVIGIVVAIVRSTWDKTHETMRPGPGRALAAALDKLCRVYLTVIRGTPDVIQLMIAYYIIFASSRNGVMIAVLAFGINSGAYVAEIIRGGIMSIDAGQLEAGRSLGFNYVQTMWYIVIPQALKNVLPSLANEFIVLLKETSVSGYVAVRDLTKGGDIIRGVTYSPFMPLLAVAAIYLVMVMFFTWLVGKLERRLRNSDH